MDTLGNENRPSIGDGTDKRYQEIPTPVFSAREDKSLTKNNIKQLDLKLKDEILKEYES